MPFKIETSIKFNAFTDIVQFLVCKRDGNETTREWQLIYNVSENQFRVALFNGSNIAYIQKGCTITPQTNTIYNIVVTYNGNGLDGLNINVNGVDGVIEIVSGNYTAMIKSNSELSLGVAKWIGGLRLNGQMDYLKIYK